MILTTGLIPSTNYTSSNAPTVWQASSSPSPTIHQSTPSSYHGSDQYPNPSEVSPTFSIDAPPSISEPGLEPHAFPSLTPTQFIGTVVSGSYGPTTPSLVIQNSTTNANLTGMIRPPSLSPSLAPTERWITSIPSIHVGIHSPEKEIYPIPSLSPSIATPSVFVDAPSTQETGVTTALSLIPSIAPTGISGASGPTAIVQLPPADNSVTRAPFTFPSGAPTEFRQAYGPSTPIGTSPAPKPGRPSSNGASHPSMTQPTSSAVMSASPTRNEHVPELVDNGHPSPNPKGVVGDKVRQFYLPIALTQYSLLYKSILLFVLPFLLTSNVCVDSPPLSCWYCVRRGIAVGHSCYVDA